VCVVLVELEEDGGVDDLVHGPLEGEQGGREVFFAGCVCVCVYVYVSG
jgi:hypothetical protein